MTDSIDEILPENLDQPADAPRSFADLSLMEVVGMLLVHPLATLDALREMLRQENVYHAVTNGPVIAAGSLPLVSVRPAQEVDWQRYLPTIYLGGLIVLGLIGSIILAASVGSSNIQPLILGGCILLTGVIGAATIMGRSVEWPRLPALDSTVSGLRFADFNHILGVYGLRIGLFFVSLIWTLGSWLFNTDNQFTTVGVFCWVMSVLTLSGALMDREFHVQAIVWYQVGRVQQSLSEGIHFRWSWTAAALIMILVIGGWYRFGNLYAYPPEMTSDHVEKLLDSVKVYEGQHPIFFPNNGGRESFQMYYLAALKSVTGLPFNFELLKIGSGLEGMLMILFAWWMGRAVFGDEDKQLGNLTGIIIAALVATSYWHTLLSRLGLRIVTTTLVVTVVFIFLARALRYNRRSDYLIAGFALGAGMYFYQAVRMLPLVVLAGFALALLIRSRSKRALREYTVNLIALVLMALVVFVPLGHYMVQNPGEFWNRTTGRLFGEAYTQDENGNITPIPFDQRLVTFQKNLPALTDNMVRSLLMFNWKGDSSWFNGSPEATPALDFFAGTMFALGIALLLIRAFRRRDPVDGLLPLAIVIMVLPSALAIAFPNEVPGFTRGSGSLPFAYLIAAFGLAVLLRLVYRQMGSGRAWIGVVTVVVVLMAIGAATNANAYFVGAMSDYRNSTLPHRQAGAILRGFIDSTGAPGNAFMVAYKYWFDHRALAIESGDVHWGNTLPTHDNLADQIQALIHKNVGGKYELNPNRQILFFLNQEDKDGMEIVRGVFPGGELIKIQAYNATRDFYLYTVPPVGCKWVLDNVGTSRYCNGAPISPNDAIGSMLAGTPAPAGTPEGGP